MSEEGITLKTTVEAYLKNMSDGGTKETTVNVYRRSLDLALAHFGEEKPLTSILAPHVSRFFGSDNLNTKNGKPKAEATVKQNKRVFRQCMAFAKEKGFISTMPIPKIELKHARSKVFDEPEKAETAATEN